MLEIKESNVDHLDEKECYNLLYFTASWCGPCKKILPLIEQISKGEDPDTRDLYDILDVYKVDLNENESLAEKLNVTSVPTFFLYYQKNHIDHFSGADITKVKQLLNRIRNIQNYQNS